MDALILIDLQNDFMPGGALAVPEGDRVVPVANRMIERFGLVLATQDWHPADHSSFAGNHPGCQVGEVIDVGGVRQTLWPAHCVQKTWGAELVAGLNTSGIDGTFLKGTDSDIDSYSAFFDNAHRKSTGLDRFLRQAGVDHVYLLGLATDYCVLFSALDARALGFTATLIEDGCRGVELKPGDTECAIRKMQDAGVAVIVSAEVNAQEGSGHH